MRVTRDYKPLWDSLGSISCEDDYSRDLLDAAKSVCSDDPEFLLGVMVMAGDDEDDAHAMIDYIKTGNGVSCSSVLRFAAALDQQHHADESDYFDD